MKYIFRSIFIEIVSILIFSSCERPASYPEIPEVKFSKYSLNKGVDLLGNEIYEGVLTITIIDGDGDIGLEDSDTTGAFSRDSMYYHNLFIKLYEKIDGKFIEFDLAVPHNFRVPYIEPQGQNKTLIADIDATVQYTNINYFNSDTIKYDFYIVDRALNKSNIGESEEISISEQINNNK